MRYAVIKEDERAAVLFNLSSQFLCPLALISHNISSKCLFIKALFTFRNVRIVILTVSIAAYDTCTEWFNRTPSNINRFKEIYH